MRSLQNSDLLLKQEEDVRRPSVDMRKAKDPVARRLGEPKEWLWIYVSVAGSLLLRFTLFDFESGDYKAFLSNWYDFLIENGRWHGLGQRFETSYPGPYLYLISLSTLVPIPKLYAIKLISVAIDYIAAWFVWRLIRRRSLSERAGWLAVTAFLFLPTVVLNGAVWGQCDMMYTTGFLASLLFLLEGRGVAALVAFGVACSLKPQAIFWCPLLAGLFLSGRLRWRWIWIPVAVYVISGIPLMLAGRPILDVLAHWGQVRDLPGLTHGTVPNWYVWGFAKYPEIFWWPGIVLTLCATAWFVLWLMKTPACARDTDRWLVSLSLLSVLFPPFFLPGMHERYFFAADILSVIYAFYVPGGWRVAALMQFASGFSYLPYLFKVEPVPAQLLPFAVIAALALVVRHLVNIDVPQLQQEDP